MKGEVRLEVQALYLDSASEVDDFRGGVDVPLEIGGDRPRPPDKHRKNMINDA
jgi:hypothetical protein